MKKNIAIVAGGDSSEVIVSLKSAAGIYNFIDKNLYHPFIVTIIGKTWQVEWSDNEKINIDKNDFSFTRHGIKTIFDFAYITIHGTPGENGLLQGYFDLIGLPYSCCGVLPAAITFNKYTCNQYLKNFGIQVANSILLRKGQTVVQELVIEKLGLPCFVKPNVGGSSFGVTKIKDLTQLQPAIDKAFVEGNEVLIESYLEGTELTCGVYRTKSALHILPITEVISQNEFFDFDAKYNGQVQEITPARINNAVASEIQKQTKRIYEILDCKGIVRIDYIVDKNNNVCLLEVNTTPGMTPTSFIPQQVLAAGLTMQNVLTEVIEFNMTNTY